MAKLLTYSTEYLPPSAPFGLISLQAWTEVLACKSYIFQSFKPTEVKVWCLTADLDWRLYLIHETVAYRIFFAFVLVFTVTEYSKQEFIFANHQTISITLPEVHTRTSKMVNSLA